MATRVPVRSAQKQYVTFPTTQRCCVCNLIKIPQLVFGDIDVLMFSHSKSMETIGPWGEAKFDPRGMNGTIYKEDH